MLLIGFPIAGRPQIALIRLTGDDIIAVLTARTGGSKGRRPLPYRGFDRAAARNQLFDNWRTALKHGGDWLRPGRLKFGLRVEVVRRPR